MIDSGTGATGAQTIATRQGVGQVTHFGTEIV